MEVDYNELALASQVLSRQQSHAAAVRTYIGTTCRVSSGDMGVLLQAFYPLSEGAIELGGRALSVTESVLSWSSRAALDTADAYVAADQAAHEDFARVMSELGESLRPYADPRDTPPSLAGAQSRAASDYGAASAWGGMDGLGDSVAGFLGTAQERVSGWTSNSTGVTERSDASSYLVTPDLGETFVDDLRWSAGPLLGSVDWLAEQLLGFSILEECVTKPFGGDWQAIGSASEGWSHSGRALMEMGNNLSGLPEQVTAWQGRAADTFRATIFAVSGAVVGLSYACDYVSGLVSTIGSVAKGACVLIASILKLISEKLLRMALEASVPVAGWIVAGAEAVAGVWQIMGWVKKINLALNLILDAIEGFIDSKEKLLQAILILEDLAEYAGKKVVGQVIP